MCYNLNSLKGVTVGVIKGDTRSLDYGSHEKGNKLALGDNLRARLIEGFGVCEFFCHMLKFVRFGVFIVPESKSLYIESLPKSSL